MTTLADLVERTRSQFYSETRPELNRLTTSIDADDSQIAVDFDLRGIQAGASLCIGTERLHVWTANANAITVARGQGGTTAASHSAGDLVYVNDKADTPSIIQAINDDLNDLSGQGLFQVKTVALDFVAGTDSYDLTSVTDLLDVVEVTYDANDGTSRWPVIPKSMWRLTRNLNTSDFASGIALTIDGWAESGRPVRVAYKAPFSPLANLSDDVAAVTGLPVTAHDLPPLGALIALSVSSEIARNFLTQMDTRRGDEVPPGARMGSWRAVAAQRNARIQAECNRLYAKYPAVRP